MRNRAAGIVGRLHELEYFVLREAKLVFVGPDSGTQCQAVAKLTAIRLLAEPHEIKRFGRDHDVEQFVFWSLSLSLVAQPPEGEREPLVADEKATP